MKRLLSLFILSILVFSLTACSSLDKESFTYLDGYLDDDIKYFDEYAEVYRNDDYDLYLYAVKSNSILDDQGNEFVNYILKWDIGKLSGFSLNCGSHSLYGGWVGWSPGGTKTHLIPGQEIFDYCQDFTEFKLNVFDEYQDEISIYTHDNEGELNWRDVSTIENSFGLFILDYTKLMVTITIIIVTASIITIGYNILFRRNYNKYVKGEKVRKLLNFNLVVVATFVLMILSIFMAISIYENPKHKNENNFFDYENQENSQDYLPEFVNEGYELIGAEGAQEIYSFAKNNDEIRFYTVLVDGDDRYLMDVLEFVYPDASDIDSCRVELYEKEIEFDGLILGYVVECYKSIDGVDVAQFALSLGVTTSIDGRVEFVDFMDSTNFYQVYFKNVKGYYRVNYLISTF